VALRLPAMGQLVESGTDRRFTLSPRCIIGRHPACDVRIDNPRASGEHASIRWTGDRWELRDLGSRNGTFVGGRRLSAAERVTLVKGVSFMLGGLDITFTLEDGSAPGACARHMKSGILRTASGGVLVLPDDERPLVSIFDDGLGRWVAESDEATRAISNHEPLVVDGDVWTVELPGAVGATWEGSPLSPTLETIRLRIAVSSNEEHVEVKVIDQGKETELPTRSFHYLLAVLARTRLGDKEASPAERGWVDRDALCKMLGVDAARLNVDIFRVRKQLGALGIHGAADLIERRSTAVRIGTDRVEVVPL
jgi:pSer/pThr/pTyr-binding forkhead associated (FHA) protein